MPRGPTVYDVATRAGVSIATVSFTYRQPHRVRQATREAVLAAADALGYVPSASARGLARGRTGSIGLYSFDYQQESTPAGSAQTDVRHFPLYVDEVQRGVQLECRRHGYALMLGAGHSARHLPDVIDVAGRVDGLIAFAGSAPPEAIAQVAKRIPVVELGGATGPDAHTVLVDNHTGMRELTDHLVRDHGFRRLVFIGQQGLPEFRARYDAFAAGLAAAGLAAPDPVPSHPTDDASTIAAVRRHLAGALPDAFVCSTDQEALVAMDTLTAAGIGVPDRVAVTGFDGTVAGRIAEPRLTTVRQPMEAVGRAAVRILASRLEGSAPDAHHAPLAAPFVPGASCGC
ncbi:LacI family DNA-binding transcriptional regulator [Actinoplanes sp. NPDC026623]|uniref:LacI family DNA-binding transcriptional regulator n=1 Tax=Actinoplanes sp. NPDC026623 TaxID=3155610 RepID=UPI0033C9906A